MVEKRFVDLHTHILPGVDDGAKDTTQAMEMLRTAWAHGTGTVVLTPHYLGTPGRFPPETLRQRFEALRRQAERELPGMRLYLGHEAANEFDLWEKLISGQVLTLAGSRYVLLEFDERVYESRVLSGVLDLINSGFVPIIAHVERYATFYHHPELAAEVVSVGAMLQINAGSLLGQSGRSAQRFVRRLLRRGLVSFVASDAHDACHRPPVLDTCYARVRRRYGGAYADMLFFENAQQILREKDSL